MAWELFTKPSVLADTGVSEAHLTDNMYEAVVDFCERWMGLNLRGSQTITNELHDGTGTDTIFVNNPPIVAVSSLSVSSYVQSTLSYNVYRSYVKLGHAIPYELERSIYGIHPVFPLGSQNVSITYVSGDVTLTADQIMGMKLMVVQLGLQKARGGSDASFRFDFSQPNQNTENIPVPGYGLGTSMQTIARIWLGKGVRMA